jgi:hypothetical protein
LIPQLWKSPAVNEAKTTPLGTLVCPQWLLPQHVIAPAELSAQV